MTSQGQASLREAGTKPRYRIPPLLPSEMGMKEAMTGKESRDEEAVGGMFAAADGAGDVAAHGEPASTAGQVKALGEPRRELGDLGVAGPWRVTLGRGKGGPSLGSLSQYSSLWMSGSVAMP